jgi:hypothetical protein
VILKRIAIFVGLLLAPLGLAVRAQEPDRRGEVTVDKPVYRGVRASAPIDPKHHVRNEGGSDGAGLCVISSILANGMHQGVPGLATPGYDERSRSNMPGKGSVLWQTAKARPGGYSPDKLEKLVQTAVPGEKYASYLGTDTSVIEDWSKKGYPIGSTLNTGKLYGYRPIHHMISLIHYRRGSWASIVDNNDPGNFTWMPSAEYDRRWLDGGVGWAFIWTRLPASAKSFAFALFLLAAALILLAASRQPQPAPMEAQPT